MITTQKQPIKALLFDFDGTLVDSAPDLGMAANQMRVDRGLPAFPLENYRHMVGSGARGMLKIAFELAPTAPEFETMREEFFRNYEKIMLQGSKPFPEIHFAINNLDDKKIPWGIVTNKMERFFLPIIQRSDWAKNAKAHVGGDTTPYAKPHPAPILEGAKQLGIPIENCVYIGDDLRDIEAGKAAGSQTAVATWGYLGEADHYNTWGADFQLAQIKDILNLLSWYSSNRVEI
ncbi:MAG: HAD-IA family hydrolase [Saezia sp.]